MKTFAICGGFRYFSHDMTGLYVYEIDLSLKIKTYQREFGRKYYQREHFQSRYIFTHDVSVFAGEIQANKVTIIPPWNRQKRLTFCRGLDSRI